MEPAESFPSISQVYLFLGKCFSYPKEEFYTLIADERIGEQLRAMVEALPFALNFRGIPAPSLPQEEFESEFINSFDVGLGPSLPCPLYESAYRAEDTSSREITEELLRFFDHFQVRLTDTERDYPDNLVIELEFMAFLAGKEAEVAKRGNDPAPYRLAQADFLERHLYKWVSRLDETIRKRIKEPFYQAASSLLQEVLSSHLAYLRKNLDRPAGAATSPLNPVAG